MNEEQEALAVIRMEVLKGFSALWYRADCRDAQSALGRCIEHLNYRDASCFPDVLKELELADAALLGRENVYAVRRAIATASLKLQSHYNSAPFERGA